MSTSWEEAILARERQHTVNHAERTADWLYWSLEDAHPKFLYARHAAYAAVVTLSNLARSSDAFLWLLYAPIITAWQGCPGDLKTRRENLAKHLQKHKQLDYTGKLLEIRMMLSQSKVRSISSQSIPAFVQSIPGKTESDYTKLRKMTEESFAITPRQGPSINTIVFPEESLVFIEADINKHLDIPKRPGSLEALSLGTVYTVVHETMHMVGSLLHSVDYTTPILVFGHFLLPKDEENQDEEYKADEDEEEEELQIGEAGEWFHTSRYGGVPVIALVCESSKLSDDGDISPDTWEDGAWQVAIVINHEDSSLLQRLIPASIQPILDRLWNNMQLDQKGHERNLQAILFDQPWNNASMDTLQLSVLSWDMIKSTREIARNRLSTSSIPHVPPRTSSPLLRSSSMNPIDSSHPERAAHKLGRIKPYSPAEVNAMGLRQRRRVFGYPMRSGYM